MALGLIQPLEKRVPGIFPGDKGGRFVGLTTLPPSCADFLEIWEPQTPRTLRACSRLQRDCSIFYLTHTITNISNVASIRSHSDADRS